VSEYSSDREPPKCFVREDSKTCPAPGLTTVLFVRRALSPASGDPFDRLPPPWTRICVVPAERPSTWALLVRAAQGSDYLPHVLTRLPELAQTPRRSLSRQCAEAARSAAGAEGRPLIRGPRPLQADQTPKPPPAPWGARFEHAPGGFALQVDLANAGLRILSDCPQWTVTPVAVAVSIAVCRFGQGVNALC
jgi:hypothetical protein